MVRGLTEWSDVWRSKLCKWKLDRTWKKVKVGGRVWLEMISNPRQMLPSTQSVSGESPQHISQRTGTKGKKCDACGPFR